MAPAQGGPAPALPPCFRESGPAVSGAGAPGRDLGTRYGPVLGHPAMPNEARPDGYPGAASRPAPVPAEPPPDLMTEAEVRVHLRVSRSTFYRMRRAGEFPKPVLLAGSIQRSRREDIITCLAGPDTAL